MKTSIEHLYHFNCDSCQKWWAIADFPWGSQSSMWCPWCGYENTLPERPSTGDDFINGQTVLSPSPGQIYRHYKHNPEAGKWHEYKVIAVVNPGQIDNFSGVYACHSSANCKHTETGEQHWLGAKGKRGDILASPSVNEMHVAYKATQGNQTVWLRPLSMFTDGRFTLVS